jgi:hypothetical protein
MGGSCPAHVQICSILYHSVLNYCFSFSKLVVYFVLLSNQDDAIKVYQVPPSPYHERDICISMDQR